MSTIGNNIQGPPQFAVNDSSENCTKHVLNYILNILKVDKKFCFSNFNLKLLQHGSLNLTNYFLHLNEDENYNFDLYNEWIMSYLTTVENNINLLPTRLNDLSNFFVTISKFIQILINENNDEDLTSQQKLSLKFIGARISLPFFIYLGTNNLQMTDNHEILKLLLDEFLKYSMYGIRSVVFGLKITYEITKTFKINYHLLTDDRFYIVTDILEVRNKKIQAEMCELLNFLTTEYSNEIEITNLINYLRSNKKILNLFLNDLLNERYVTILIAINPICSTDYLFNIFLKIFDCNNHSNLMNLVVKLYTNLLKSTSTNLNNSDILASSLQYLSQVSNSNGISIFLDAFWDFEFIKDVNNIITNIINVITDENNLNTFIIKFCVEYTKKLSQIIENTSSIILITKKIPLFLSKLQTSTDISAFLEIFEIFDLNIYKQLDVKHFGRVLHTINNILDSCTDFKNISTVELISQIFHVMNLFYSADLHQSKKIILDIKHVNITLFNGCFQRLTANERNVRTNQSKWYKVLTISLLKLTFLIINANHDDEEFNELFKYLIEFFEKSFLKEKMFRKFTNDFNDITAESNAIRCITFTLLRYSTSDLLKRTYPIKGNDKFRELCYYFVKYLLETNIYERTEIDYVSNTITALISCMQYVCDPKNKKFYVAKIRNFVYNQTINQLLSILTKNYTFWDQPITVVDEYFATFYNNLINIHHIEVDSDSISKILLYTDVLKWNEQLTELMNVFVTHQSAEGTASLLSTLIFQIAIKQITTSNTKIVDELQVIIQRKLPIKCRRSKSELNFLIIESAAVMKVLEKLLEAASKRTCIPEDGNIMTSLKSLEKFLQYFRIYPAEMERFITLVRRLKAKIWINLNRQEIQYLLSFQKVLLIYNNERN